MDINDKEVATIINKEYTRQKNGIELIASENFTSQNVLDTLGSIMTNKYSEGQPGQRYYGGNEYIDEMENLCKDRALNLFKLNKEDWSANVQPYSGSPANLAVFTALLEPNDRIMGLSLSSGGHLTHGHYTDKKNVSATSIFFQSLPYEIDPVTGLIDYAELKKKATAFRPKCIVAGGSAYPRDWDYKEFYNIAKDIGAYLVCDIAHIAGLVATNQANNPFTYADVVTTTTHKSLRGPRSGIIFSKKHLSDKIDFAVFPSLQGGPHNNVISAVAVALKEATTDDFYKYISNVKENTKELARVLMDYGYKLCTDGTDNHLILMDLRNKKITGSKIEYILEKINISVNKNTIIGDKNAFSPGGIRIGLCAMTTRGIRKKDCFELARLINDTIQCAINLQEEGLQAMRHHRYDPAEQGGTPRLEASGRRMDINLFKEKVDTELQNSQGKLSSLKEDVYQFTKGLSF